MISANTTGLARTRIKLAGGAGNEDDLTGEALERRIKQAACGLMISLAEINTQEGYA